MKALFLLFFISVVSSQAEWLPKKPYPKKVVNQELSRSIHLRRYMTKDKNTPLKNALPKRETYNKDYTVFPIPGSTIQQDVNVPDSPYFPLGETLRSKKELISPNSRKKRSIDDDINVEHIVQRRKRSVANKSKKAAKAKARKGVAKKKTKRVSNKKSARAQKPKAGDEKKVKTVRQGKRKGKVETVEGRRLISAQDAIIEDYPYCVSIQKGREHWCSGALLNQRLVITTANCVWKGRRLSRLRVRAGTRHVDRGGQVVKVQEIMKHPFWDIRSYPDNDVALLLLEKRIRFSHSVHGVDLPNRIMLPPFNDVWVTSYGANIRSGLYPEPDMTLQVYHAQLMDREKCNNITSRFGVAVTDNFICVTQTGKRAPCTRDTGAPAVSDGVVWGLASWGIRKICGTERYPAVFSYLASSSNMNFIANATKSLMAEERFYPFLDRFPMRGFNLKDKYTTLQYYTGQH